jgi:hypothetical protein
MNYVAACVASSRTMVHLQCGSVVPYSERHGTHRARVFGRSGHQFLPDVRFGDDDFRIFGQGGRGSLVAGVIGGTILGFLWPFLFLLNMWTGSVFLAPPVVVNELDDVTPKTMDTLMWGTTFMTGAILNSVLVGGSVYLLIILVYHRIRPGVLAFLRRQSRYHQLRFRPWRRRRVVRGPGFLL